MTSGLESSNFGKFSHGDRPSTLLVKGDRVTLEYKSSRGDRIEASLLLSCFTPSTPCPLPQITYARRN
ncbi:hypothetical protein H6F75_18715 [Nodosilinea sp. FACHB-131]|uniref:hypothetical protein n=1 Tax=Cyanophyceae TaxID=3028117 RepID=UPI001682383C|nr:hypothetical protein [Nodosilinea sp. FACHB-131]MBD1875517.1 hypothetical protein [Nodosilinea sp. FACHB-131]